MIEAIICDIQGVLIGNNRINKDLINFLIGNKNKYGFLILYSNLSLKNIDNLKKTIPSFFSSVDKFYSYESVGYPKPNPKGFEKILKEFNLKPENVIFIDDREDNIETAKDLGFKVIHYKNFGEISILDSFLSQ